jgi:hypothetical protein
MRIALTFGLVLVAAAAAGQIRVPVDESALNARIVQMDGMDRIVLPGAKTVFPEGAPDLPGTAAAYVLPQGTELVDARIEGARYEPMGRYDLATVRMVPIGDEPGAYLYDQAWLEGGIYPESPVVDFHTGRKTGFVIGSCTVTPYRYDLSSGQLEALVEGELVLEYAPSNAPSLTLSNTQVQMARQALESVVDNPGELRSRAPMTTDSGKDWAPWIAVGDEDMEDELQPLVDHRASTHGAAEFVSLQYIYDNYSGYDTQEQIRNFLKDGYENHGLVYALIIGDFGETNRISKLTVYGNTLNSTADLYYSDLDGTWDGNGNHLYGENADGIDYYSDIYVGRFSADNPAWITTMVDKTVAYEDGTDSGEWYETALFCGAVLWPEYSYTGATVCNEVADMLPSGWTAHKLYENLSGTHPNNQIDMLNEGAAYFQPTGHGYSNGVFWYYSPSDMITNSNYTGLTNIDMLPVIHSIACLAGKLSAASLSERLMLAPNGGCVANMFNSDNGWGSPPSMGPSEWLNIYVAEQLFEEEQYEIGVTHALGKDAFVASGGMAYKNWVLQENNLLGDPALMFVTGQTGVETPEPQSPSTVGLRAPFPNPTAGAFSVTYSLPEAASGELAVYDMTGRRVRTIAAGELQAGDHTVHLDGGRLPTGCYNVLLRTGMGTASQRVVVIR